MDVSGGPLRRSGSFAPHGRPEADRKNSTHRDEVGRPELDLGLGAVPVVAAVQLWNRCSCEWFPLAGGIPKGTARLPAGLIRGKADHAKWMAGLGTADLCQGASIERALVSE